MENLLHFSEELKAGDYPMLIYLKYIKMMKYA